MTVNQPDPVTSNCRVCDRPFGQDNRKSREHVIPDWLQREFGLTKQNIAYTPLESLAIPASMQLTGVGPSTPQRSHNFGTLLLGAVCTRCNNGWMSQLEEDARPDLINLITGNVEQIQSRRAVARWALKTSFTLATATDAPVGRVPQRHMMHLKIRPDLPVGVNVFYRMDDRSEWWFSSSTTFNLEVEEPYPPNVSARVRRYQRNGYRHFFRLGKLTLLCEFWPDSTAVAYFQSDLVAPLDTTNRTVPLDDGFGGTSTSHLNHDLASRSTRYRMRLGPRSDSDLCICGSGLLSTICHQKGHPADTAGNWGWL